MHIAINCLLVYGSFSGVQHAIVHQVRALLNQQTAHRYSLLSLQDVALDEIIGPTRLPYQVLRTPVRAGQRLRRIYWEQWSLPAMLQQAKADLLYAPGYLTSLRWQRASVVFIHDTIALSHPQLSSFSNALNYRVLLPPSARHATRVAVPSHCSAADVARYCGVAPEKIDVTPLGVVVPPMPSAAEIRDARQRLGFTVPFVLAVSTIEPKKNFDSLIRWFDAWVGSGIEHHLVIIGKYGWKCASVRHALRAAQHRERIHLPGYWPQEALPACMAAAEMLLMPSRYEGFGLPVLEAMAVGTPVVVSDRGALPETVGDAGLVLPLHDETWGREIPLLLRDAARLARMREAGFVRARMMSWESSAAQLSAVLEKAYHQMRHAKT